jgi:hypothetical protein
VQRVAQALVLDDGGGVDLRQSVIALIDQVDAVGAQLDAPIRVLEDIDVPMDQLAVAGASLSR